ncbi:unnamed protein product, partial [Porites lobata]
SPSKVLTTKALTCTRKQYPDNGKMTPRANGLLHYGDHYLCHILTDHINNHRQHLLGKPSGNIIFTCATVYTARDFAEETSATLQLAMTRLRQVGNGPVFCCTS